MHRPGSGTPLVGRARELDLLRGAMAAALDGSGSVVVVEGPAGIGKTTLVDRLVGDDLTGGPGPPMVVTGVCAATTATVPLWPWQRALRHRPGLVPATPGGTTDRAPVSEGGAPGALAVEQLRRAAACADGVVAAAHGAGSLVVVLEDWHWSDTASRALLHLVAEGCRRAPLLVVVTSRRDPAASALRRLPGVRHVPLGPLDRDDVAAYLRLSDRADDDADVDRVVGASGGLPWLVVAAADQPGTRARDDGMAAVAASATAGLDPVRTRVLVAAAQLDDVTDPGLLAAVCRVTTSTVVATLGLARRAGVVTGDGFSHDLVRQAVAALDPTGAAAVCRAGAEELGRRAGASPSRLVALWALAGDDPSCVVPRARAALDAGRVARRALALDDARDVLVGALGPTLLAHDPELASEVALEAAQVAFDLGDVLGSLALCEAAAGAADRAGRGDLLARAALVSRSVMFPRVRDATARLASRALDLDPPPAVRSRLLSQLAAAAADRADVTAAQSLAERSLHLAERTRDPAALLDAYRAQEAVLTEGPDAGRERLRLGEGTVAEGQRLGQPLAAAIGHGWRLTAGVELCRDEVVDDAVACLDDLARSGNPFVRWHERRAVAGLAVLFGDFGTAREASAEALTVALLAGDVVGAGMSKQLSLELAHVRGDATELPDDIDAALEAAPPIPIIQVSRASLAVVRGRPEDAVPYYEQVMAHLDGALADVRGRGVAFTLTALAVTLGDVDGGSRLLRALDVYRTHEGGIGSHTAYFHGSPRRQLGRVAALAGRRDEAERHLRAAVRVDVRLRARPQACLARLDLARLLTSGTTSSESGGAEARGLAAQVADEAARLDMPGPLAEARHLLGASPAPPGGPGSAGREATGTGLTPREGEIADLVRRGLSNREIAAALVVSERTVETHVSHALRKLGHRNRRELLAGRAADGPPP